MAQEDMDMAQEDIETRDYVKEKSNRIFASAVFGRLRIVVASWEAEERGKGKVLQSALIGLLAVLALAMLVGYLAAGFAVDVLLLGFLLWTGYFIWLIRRHLGAKNSGSDPELNR
jgi:hypothetical protein